MQVTETLSDNLKREYTVVIAAKDLGEKLDARLEQIGQEVRLPGFRPGKVPMTILRKRFSQSVMGEVIEQAVRDSSAQALTERGLRPAMQPKIEITAFEEGKDLEYKIAVELLPDIEVGDLSKIELERIKIDVPEAEVEEALGRLASAKRETTALDTPRPAEKGDVLVIDFQGTVDGEALPGMAGEDHHLELGSNRFVEGFEDQLIGAEAGQQRSVTVTFPEQYVNDKLAGREAVFDVTVKEVRATVPRAIDDSLAKDLGEADLTTLRSKVAEQLQGDYDRLTRTQLKRQLLDALAKSYQFEVPPGMVDSEFEAIWKQIEEERSHGHSDPEDEGKSDDELKAEYREIAERRVRLGLLLSEVGRLNGIEVNQDELNRALMMEAQNHPGHERKVLEFYQNSPEALANLRAPLFEDKVVDFILDLAKVSERKVSPEDFQDEATAAAGEAGAKPAAKSGAKSKKPAAKKPAAKRTTSRAKSGGAAKDADKE
ncbi:MAG: trigger factor [Kiloniellales bacterium]|nr:trigger factor [Kiloniellales bacterium]